MASEEGQRIYSPISARVPNTTQLIKRFWLPAVIKTYDVQNGRAFLDAYRQSMPDMIGEPSKDTLWANIVKPDGWDPMMAGALTANDALSAVDRKVQAALDDIWRTKQR